MYSHVAQRSEQSKMKAFVVLFSHRPFLKYMFLGGASDVAYQGPRGCYWLVPCYSGTCVTAVALLQLCSIP